MSKFLCNGVIEFPADKMDIVASVLRKHGLEDPNFKEECRTKGEKATYFLKESYGMLFDKDTFKKAFLELLDQGIYMVVNILYSATSGTGKNMGSEQGMEKSMISLRTRSQSGTPTQRIS